MPYTSDRVSIDLDFGSEESPSAEIVLCSQCLEVVSDSSQKRSCVCHTRGRLKDPNLALLDAIIQCRHELRLNVVWLVWMMKVLLRDIAARVCGHCRPFKRVLVCIGMRETTITSHKEQLLWFGSTYPYSYAKLSLQMSKNSVKVNYQQEWMGCSFNVFLASFLAGPTCNYIPTCSHFTLKLPKDNIYHITKLT